jgi:hypothetical protein
LTHLKAWDIAACESVQLEAGLAVLVLRIRCEPLGASAAAPYLTEFECGGRTYTCPLYSFQARTQTAGWESAESLPERKVAAG